MTQISDYFFTGAAQTNTLIGDPQSALGIRAGQTYIQDFVPLTKNTAAYAALQTPVASAITLSAGTGVSAVVVNGVTRFQCDVPRCVTFSSGGNDSGITFKVSGFDKYGAAMTQTITGGNGATVTTKKAFYSVISAVPSGSVATTVTVGTSDTFGVDIGVSDLCYLYTVGNQSKAIDTGTGLIWDTTTPATSLTGDVRGTYAPSFASNGTARLVIETTMNANQLVQGSAAQTAVLGVTQA
jgi:hypothetical protein